MKSLAYKIFGYFVSACIALILSVALAVFILTATETGSGLTVRTAVSWANANLPLDIAYDDVSGTVFNGLAFQGLRVEQGTGLQISADAFTGDWNLWPLLDGQVRINALESENLQITTAPAPGPAPESAEPVDLEAIFNNIVFNLPLTFRIDNLALDNTTLNLGGQVISVERLATGVRLDRRRLALAGLRLAAFGTEISGDATLSAGDLALDGVIDWRISQPAAFGLGFVDVPPAGSVELGGNLNTLAITHRLQAPATITSTGSVNIGVLDGTSLRFDLRHDIDNLAPFITAAAGDTPLQSLGGQLTTRGTPDNVSLEGNLNLATALAAPLEIALDADYTGGGIDLTRIAATSREIEVESSGRIALQPQFGLDLEWTLNALNPGDRLPAVNLGGVTGSGSVALETAPAGTRIAVELASLSGDLNGYPLDADGNIELMNGRVENLDLAIRQDTNALTLSGSITETYNIDWSLNAPSLASILADLGGGIQGEGTLRGPLQSPRVAGNLSAETVSYTAGGESYRLGSARAVIATDQDRYAIELDLSGLDIPQAGSAYTIDQGRASFSGTPADHTGSISIESEALAFSMSFAGGLGAGNWAGSITESTIDSEFGQWRLAEAFDLEAGAAGVDYSRHCWNYLDTSVCSSGSWRAAGGFTLSAAVNAFPLGYLNAQPNLAEYSSSRLMRLFTEKPPGLENLQEIHGVYLPPNTFIDGTVSVQLDAAGTFDALQDAAVDVSVMPENLTLGLVRQLEGEQQSLQPEVNEFAFADVRLTAGQQDRTRQATAAFRIMQGAGEGPGFEGELESNLTLNPQGSLNGRVEFDFPDIVWLETVVPALAETRGSLTADVGIAGNLERPLFTAEVDLNDGAFVYPQYGINAENLQVSLRSDENNELRLDGSLTSGEGSLQFSGTGSTPFLPGRSFSLQLQGENFRAIDSERIQVALNPDMQIAFADNALDITGRIVIPVLDMNLIGTEVALNSGQVNVSGDTVIVAAPGDDENTFAVNARRQLQQVPVTADFELILEEGARFQGYGLDLTLAGDLQMRQSPNRPLLAYGDVTITGGTYEIYNQELTIESGELIFFGNPANPALDIRAYREAPNVRAGIQINGTLRNMQSQLYSTPAMPENEILAVLITGKSFSDTTTQDQNALLNAITNLGIERGQGITNAIRSELGLDLLALNAASGVEQSSIGLGKYLTSDLFIQYDVGLFEKESSLSLDYFLNDRLKLEVESGISQSIDLTYTVEK